jgi:hypothetical protein
MPLPMAQNAKRRELKEVPPYFPPVSRICALFTPLGHYNTMHWEVLMTPMNGEKRGKNVDVVRGGRPKGIILIR